MSAFEGVKNLKLNGGMGTTNPSDDAVGALVCGGVVTAGYATLGEVVTLLQSSDAEDLGINAAYDATNKVLVYHHISEFFRLQPEGKLHLMLVAQGTTLAQMVDKDLLFLAKLLLDEKTERAVKFAGVVLNPLAAYVPAYTNGVNADVLAAIPKAQALIEDLAARSIYIDSIVLDGRMEEDATLANLPDLRTNASRNVSVVIGQDPAIAALDALYADYTAVGSVLGMIAVRKVNECIGSVDIEVKPSGKEALTIYPLTGNGYWLSASLSSGTLFSELTVNEQNTLDEKGYIFAGKYEGFSGIYLNDSPTCVELADDYAWIEQNRVWNKAARLVRAALLPKMKSSVNIDESTGQIASTTIANWETIANKAVKPMLQNNEVSSVEITIDPAQDILGGEPLITLTTITARGIARDVINKIGYANPAS